MSQQTLGYHPGQTVLHRINATAKMLFLLLATVAAMTTYDTRYLVVIAVSSLFLFKLGNIKWHQISFVMTFIFFFSILNVVVSYLFEPEYGVRLYESRHVLFNGWGRFTVTQEELFYLLNLSLKYVCTIPLAITFLLTTNPSNFASSLNKLGVSYKISYAVALALRYIPDIQEDFFSISQAQQARGLEMSKKGKLSQRIKGISQIILPLIFSSLDRIDTISTAMELRRFGQKKTRTWYTAEPYRTSDYVVIGFGILLCIITLGLFYLNGGRFYNPFH